MDYYDYDQETVLKNEYWHLTRETYLDENDKPIKEELMIYENKDNTTIQLRLDGIEKYENNKRIYGDIVGDISEDFFDNLDELERYKEIVDKAIDFSKQVILYCKENGFWYE